MLIPALNSRLLNTYFWKIRIEIRYVFFSENPRILQKIRLHVFYEKYVFCKKYVRGSCARALSLCNQWNWILNLLFCTDHSWQKQLFSKSNYYTTDNQRSDTKQPVKLKKMRGVSNSDLQDAKRGDCLRSIWNLNCKLNIPSRTHFCRAAAPLGCLVTKYFSSIAFFSILKFDLVKLNVTSTLVPLFSSRTSPDNLPTSIQP